MVCKSGLASRDGLSCRDLCILRSESRNGYEKVLLAVENRLLVDLLQNIRYNFLKFFSYPVSRRSVINYSSSCSHFLKDFFRFSRVSLTKEERGIVALML